MPERFKVVCIPSRRYTSVLVYVDLTYRDDLHQSKSDLFTNEFNDTGTHWTRHDESLVSM